MFGHSLTRRHALISLTALGASGSCFLFYRNAKLSGGNLSPSRFTPCSVVSTENSGPRTKLITLSVPENLLKGPSFHPIWSVFIKDDDIQVERPYTPLLVDNNRLVFWIKSYPNGEVGRWLHSKQLGDQVEIRGPLQTWPWKEDAWDDIVMISGGTGITPFYQLFSSVISRDSSSRTRFALIHSSRIPQELPPPIILTPLASFANEHPEKFQLHVFVDSQGPRPSSLDPRISPKVGNLDQWSLSRCLDRDASFSWWNIRTWLSESDKNTRRTLFLVCGPDGMVSAIAGPYGRNFAQGPVGGILKEMGYTSDQVWKL